MFKYCFIILIFLPLCLADENHYLSKIISLKQELLSLEKKRAKEEQLLNNYLDSLEKSVTQARNKNKLLQQKMKKLQISSNQFLESKLTTNDFYKFNYDILFLYDKLPLPLKNHFQLFKEKTILLKKSLQEKKEFLKSYEYKMKILDDFLNEYFVIRKQIVFTKSVIPIKNNLKNLAPTKVNLIFLGTMMAYFYTDDFKITGFYKPNSLTGEWETVISNLVEPSIKHLIKNSHLPTSELIPVMIK